MPYFDEFQQTILIRLLIAFVAGMAIGYDREKSGKVAGMRTQMLVCVGSAMLTGISIYLSYYYGPGDTDPARLMAQIVSGVGFLGAGVIIKMGEKLVGVTTAATIWITAAIGMAIGAGFYLPGLVGVIMVMMLGPIGHLQYWMGLKGNYFHLHLSRSDKEEVQKILGGMKIKEKQVSVEGDKLMYVLYSSAQRNEELMKLMDKNGIGYQLEQMDGPVE